MFAYRIERTDIKGKTVVCEVLVEEGRYRCRRSGRSLPHCQGHDSLREALAAHPQLTLVGGEHDISIESAELPDYRIVPLLVPKTLSAVTVNGYYWELEKRGDRIEARQDGGIQARPDREEHWALAEWDTRPEEVFTISEADEILDRLGDFYAISSTLMEESGPEVSADFYCEDPAEAIAHLLGLSGALGNKLSWIEAPVLQGDDDAVEKALGKSVLSERKRAHVVWVNRELWEWPVDGGIRRRRPSADQPEDAVWPKDRAMLPDEILIGRDTDEKWASIRPAESCSVWDDSGTALEEFPYAWVVSLPPLLADQAVDPLAYEQLLEATRKWPEAGFSDAQPPYALLRFTGGSVGYGVLLRKRDEAERLAAAFGLPFVYSVEWDHVIVMCGEWSARYEIQGSIVEPPEDRTFMVQMIGYYW